MRCGALATGSEIGFATVAEGKRMANKIAANLGNFFVSQAWIPPDAVKKPFFKRPKD
jgi:hypothetical protein